MPNKSHAYNQDEGNNMPFVMTGDKAKLISMTASFFVVEGAVEGADAEGDVMEEADAEEEAEALIMTAAPEMPAEEIGDRVDAPGMAAGMLTVSCDMLCKYIHLCISFQVP